MFQLNRRKAQLAKPAACFLAALLAGGLAACGAPQESGSSSQPANPPASSPEPSTASQENASSDVSLEGVSMKVWAPLYWVGKVMSYDENEAWQEAQKRTGIRLIFEHPPAGQEKEQFNLMIASDTLPDMISTNWDGDGLYIGGGDKYIDEGVVLRLNELIDQYAPDYKKTIETCVPADEQKEFYTDNGNMFEFYAISPYEEWTHNGIQYRQDWMDELGLKNPETFEEIEQVLTAFRDQKGAKNPLVFPKTGIDGNSGLFLTSWDIGPSFYQKDGTVLYGPVQPEFKEYLALLSDWYHKGLIDKDFPTRDDDAMKRLITSGEAGAIIHSPDTVSAWMEGISTMMGGNYPVAEKGKRVQYRLKNYRARPPYAWAVTTACTNPEAAVKFLNYGYTEEGYMLYNYGIEGDTYNKTGEKVTYNGIEYDLVQYTDKMLGNPDYPVLDAIAKFKVHIGPFLRFEHEGNPAINHSTSGIRQFWTDAADTALNMPMVTMNAEEGKEYARIMNQINTYQDTSVLQFIMGTKSLDDFDAYVQDMEKLEIGKAVSIQQAALDRYNNR